MSLTEEAPFDAGFPPPPRRQRPTPPSWLKPALTRQVRHLNDAVPLALAGVLGLGILLYFALPFEPGLPPSLLLSGLGVLIAATQFWRSRRRRWLSLVPAVVCLGFAATVWQAQDLGDHMLEEPAYNITVTGKVQNILWRADGPRFVLTALQFPRATAPGNLRTVQIKWRGSEPDADASRALLGQTVQWQLTLLPVRGAIVPGGFDFRRQAFFKGLSAYGYSLDAPRILAEGPRPRTESWRQTIRARFVERLSGDAGGLATALVVGLRGDLSARAEAQIRAAGLAHILAISGLHIGMVTGALFFLVRLLGGWLPRLSLRFSTHHFAAVVAVVGAVLYFTISGGSVPTQRATIVVAIAMSAILLSRRPFSLRSVGLAALLVLMVQPSSLVTASFQMSFAAVIGLIIAFRFAEVRAARDDRAPRRALNYVLGLSTSSLIATAATGVFALYHFQQLSLLGIIANVVAVPLTALWIMPLLMISVLLVPLGAEGPVLWLAQWGLEALLGLAALVSRFDAGLLTTRDWPPLSLFLASFSLCAGALLVRPFTALTAIPAAAALVIAMLSPLPLVVADRGEDVLAAQGKAPFIGFGTRAGSVYVAQGNAFASEQMARFYNAAVVPCALGTCVIEGNGDGDRDGPEIWLSNTPQVSGFLCQTKPQAAGFTLAAAPRAACGGNEVVDLRQIPRNQQRAFTINKDGQINSFQPKKGRIQRFWTIDPKL